MNPGARVYFGMGRFQLVFSNITTGSQEDACHVGETYENSSRSMEGDKHVLGIVAHGLFYFGPEPCLHMHCIVTSTSMPKQICCT
jgi:hypothetical protein